MIDWRDFSDDGLTPPLRAARELFARHGYHATPIRAIAEAADLSVPGLYHHYPSKQAILDALVTAVMGQMLAHTRAADEAASTPGTGHTGGAAEYASNRFDNVVEALLHFHMRRRDDAFVASTEMRSMAPDVLSRHIAQRDEQQEMLRMIIADGIAAGVFDCPHAGDAARAVASLCVSVAGWYRPDGPMPDGELVRRHIAISRRIIGAPEKT